MTRIKHSARGTTPFSRLLGHSDSILEKWDALDDELANRGRLSSELKEQVRRVLATGNGCTYCQAKGKPALTPDDVKLSCAMGFAEVFLYERDQVKDAQFDMLKEYFSDEEISELVAFICFTTAQQYFGALMKLQPTGGEI